MEQETYLTVKQFAQLINTPKYNIYNWIYAGKLPYITLTGTHAIRIPLNKAITHHPATKPTEQETR